MKASEIIKSNIIKRYYQISLTEVSDLIKSAKRGRTLCLRAKSRAHGLSSIIFPKARTACSATIDDDLSSFNNFDTVSHIITNCICLTVSEVMIANRDAIWNCKEVLNRNKEIISYS